MPGSWSTSKDDVLTDWLPFQLLHVFGSPNSDHSDASRPDSNLGRLLGMSPVDRSPRRPRPPGTRSGRPPPTFAARSSRSPRRRTAVTRATRSGGAATSAVALRHVVRQRSQGPTGWAGVASRMGGQKEDNGHLSQTLQCVESSHRPKGAFNHPQSPRRVRGIVFWQKHPVATVTTVPDTRSQTQRPGRLPSDHLPKMGTTWCL